MKVARGKSGHGEVKIGRGLYGERGVKFWGGQQLGCVRGGVTMLGDGEVLRKDGKG